MSQWRKKTIDNYRIGKNKSDKKEDEENESMQKT